MARALCGGAISSRHRATWPAACSDTTSFRRASSRDPCALVPIFPSLPPPAGHPLPRNQMGIRRPGALKQALISRIALAIPVFARFDFEIEFLELVLPLGVHAVEDIRDPTGAGLADPIPASSPNEAPFLVTIPARAALP